MNQQKFRPRPDQKELEKEPRKKLKQEETGKSVGTLMEADSIHFA